MGKKQPGDITKAMEKEILGREMLNEYLELSGRYRGCNRVARDAVSWQGFWKKREEDGERVCR